MWKVVTGVVVGVFVGALAFEIFKRRPSKRRTARPAAEQVPVGPFDVVLVAAGDNVIVVVRELRESLGIGIGKAKELAEAAPTTVAHAVDYEKAERCRKKLESAGCTVEIKPSAVEGTAT